MCQVENSDKKRDKIFSSKVHILIKRQRHKNKYIMPVLLDDDMKYILKNKANGKKKYIYIYSQL